MLAELYRAPGEVMRSKPPVKTARSSGCRRLRAGADKPRGHWLILGLCVTTALLVVGCGSSTRPVPPSEPQPSTETEEAPVRQSVEESDPEPGGSLSNVGTLTESDGEGTTFSDAFRIGPLLYGNESTPPEEVLVACNLTDPTETATSVFARGRLTMTYQEGRLPIEVNLGGGYGGIQEVNQGEEYGEGQLDSAVAFRVGGEWWCVNGGGAIEFQEGESQTLPVWVIVSRVLSNARPRLPKSVVDAWHFEAIGPPLGVGLSPIARGPGAATCQGAYGSEEHLLFLYNRSGTC